MKSSRYLLIALALVIFTACEEEQPTEGILRSTEYTLSEVGGSGITGKATFTEDVEGATEVLIELAGSTTAVNPAFIRFNSAAEGGSVALTLTVCECSVSHTLVKKLDGGTSISYNDLLQLDGHITIHASETDDTIVAVADIGTNGN